MSIDNHSLAPMIIPENYPEPITKSPPPKPMGVVSYTFLLALNGIAKTCYHLAKPPRHMVPVDIFRARLTTTFPELRKSLLKLQREWNPHVMNWLHREMERLRLQESFIRAVLICPKKTFWQMGEQDVSHSLYDFIERISVLSHAGETLLGIQYLLEHSHHEFRIRHGKVSQHSSPEWNEWVVEVRRLTPPDLEVETEWREAKTLLEEGSQLFSEAEQEEIRKHREDASPPRILEPKTTEGDLINQDTAEVIVVSGVTVYCLNGKRTPFLIREARDTFRAKEAFLTEWRTELLTRKNDHQALANLLHCLDSLPALESDVLRLVREMETFHDYESQWFTSLCEEAVESTHRISEALKLVTTTLIEDGYTRYDHRRIERMLRSFLPEPPSMSTPSPSPEIPPITLNVEALASEAVEIWLKDRRGLQMELDPELGYLVSHVVMTFPKHAYGEVTSVTMQDYCESRLSIPDAQERFFGKRAREAVNLTNTCRRGDSISFVPEGITQESSIYSTVVTFHDLISDCTHTDQTQCLCSPLEILSTGGFV